MNRTRLRPLLRPLKSQHIVETAVDSNPVGPLGTFSLAHFTKDGYDKGRGVGWQLAWFATTHLAFQKWWFPPMARPHLLRLFGASTGRGILIRHNVRIQWPWKLSLGEDVWIGEGAWLITLEPVSIGSNVCISQGAMICTGSHDRTSPSFAFANRPITIRDGSWIGAGAVLLCGTTVGEGAVIGAGVVARGDIPPNVVLQLAEPMITGERWTRERKEL